MGNGMHVIMSGMEMVRMVNMGRMVEMMGNALRAVLQLIFGRWTRFNAIWCHFGTPSIAMGSGGGGSEGAAVMINGVVPSFG